MFVTQSHSLNRKQLAHSNGHIQENLGEITIYIDISGIEGHQQGMVNTPSKQRQETVASPRPEEVRGQSGFHNPEKEKPRTLRQERTTGQVPQPSVGWTQSLLTHGPTGREPGNTSLFPLPSDLLSVPPIDKIKSKSKAREQGAYGYISQGFLEKQDHIYTYIYIYIYIYIYTHTYIYICVYIYI